jgi:uncharacterized membrane protein
MLELAAIITIAVITSLALRRVRDRALAALAVAGLVLVLVPVAMVNGDVTERVISLFYVYAPYWEYLTPLALAALLLLPGRREKRKRGRRTGGSEVIIV